MKVMIEEMPSLRVATVPHSGPYSRISEAFQRLVAVTGPAGLWRDGALWVAIYHDDPKTTPAEQLHSFAGLSIPDQVPLPSGVVEKRLAAGCYARATHIGPYTTLPDAWSRMMAEWLPSSGQRVGNGPTYELYRNDPSNTRPEELRTDLYIPIA
jgi:AraC family transcriptional regulator